MQRTWEPKRVGNWGRGGGEQGLQKAISELPNCASVSKRVIVQNLSYENNSFAWKSRNEHVGGTPFHMNGFTRRLVLTQRQKSTQIGLFPVPTLLAICSFLHEAMILLPKTTHMM